MDDPRELEFLKNFKPSIDDLKMKSAETIRIEREVDQLRYFVDAEFRMTIYNKPYYPKPFVDWLCSLTRNMWNNSDNAYEYWEKNIKNKKG
jgi:hypothetical protein